jgi:hypothetical protein
MELKLGSGEAVIDRFNSHVHNGVAHLLPEALAKINSRGRQFFIEEVGFGQPVGETICVVTGHDDEIVYAKRPKRYGHSRFVKNRKPEPCSAVTVILKRDECDPYYVLITAFVGHRPEPEPWDRNANGNSRAFWEARALIWGCEETIPGTETTECPW